MNLQIALIIGGGILYPSIAGTIMIILISDHKPFGASIIAGILWLPLLIYALAENALFIPRK